MFSPIQPRFASGATMASQASPTSSGSSGQPPSMPAETKKIMQQAAFVAACNQLELENLASRGLKNMSALSGTLDPRQLDHYSRAINIKPGLHNLMGDTCTMSKNSPPCP